MIFDIQATLLTKQKYIVNKSVLIVYGDQQLLRLSTQMSNLTLNQKIKFLGKARLIFHKVIAVY